VSPSEPTLLPLADRTPSIENGAWVAPGAIVVGDVRLEARASLWYAAILRGDGDAIVVGADANIQDGCVLHADPGMPVRVGARVSVGHRAVLHGCIIEDEVLVGMGAVVLNGARIGTGSIVAAGSVVLEGTTIPANALVAGIPAKVRRSTTEQERHDIVVNAEHYVALASRHAHGLE
jgi:carbonic anhydrase/acetyltransferase-like protein (isoleucine patch superfamily)